MQNDLVRGVPTTSHVCRAESGPGDIYPLKLGGGQELWGDDWRERREISSSYSFQTVTSIETTDLRRS